MARGYNGYHFIQHLRFVWLLEYGECDGVAGEGERERERDPVINIKQYSASSTHPWLLFEP